MQRGAPTTRAKTDTRMDHWVERELNRIESTVAYAWAIAHKIDTDQLGECGKEIDRIYSEYLARPNAR